MSLLSSLKRFLLVPGFLLLFFLLETNPAQAGDTIRVGALRLTSSAPVFIALERGLFQEEGLNVEVKFMKSAQPVAMALAAGDLDVGATGLTAGLYNAMANGLKIRIVADKGRVWPGYKLVGIMVSNDAWNNGIRTLSDLKGKRVGITQIGSTFHYMLGNILAKNNMRMEEVKPTPLGGVKNMMDAVASDRIESSFLVQPFCTAMEKKGAGHVMFWASQEISYQIAAVFFSEKLVADRPVALRFLRAYIRACRIYYDNCLKMEGNQLVKGPEFDQVIGYISKYTDRRPELVAEGLNYNDRNGELFQEDIQRQIDWYVDHKMIGKRLDAERITHRDLWQKAMESLGNNS